MLKMAQNLVADNGEGGVYAYPSWCAFPNPPPVCARCLTVPTIRTTKRVVPVGVPGPEQRMRAPGASVGVANQSAGQPATPQRCFVRPRPEQTETGEAPPSKRRCLGPRATVVNAAATEAPRGRFEGRQRGRH